MNIRTEIGQKLQENFETIRENVQKSWFPAENREFEENHAIINDYEMLCDALMKSDWSLINQYN
jgi:hypothetical protein